jgi:flagellar assembly factor FliW
MIRFETSRFGTLEVKEDKIINFPQGLIGLPWLRRFVLIDHRDTPVKWLQAVDDPDIAFIVVPPELIVNDFSMGIDDAVRNYLEIEDDADLVVLVTMRVKDNDVIANLKGPIVINSKNMRGVQLILER